MAAPKTQSRTQAANEAAAEQENTTPEATAETNGATDGGTTPEDAAKAAAEAKESERERKAKEKAEAEEKARQALIESGDLIVAENFEFAKGKKDTKVTGQVQQIIEVYRASDVPLVFADVVKGPVGATYPEDLIPAMHALEYVGLVVRFDAKSTADGAGNRRSTAYLWVGPRDEMTDETGDVTTADESVEATA